MVKFWSFFVRRAGFSYLLVAAMVLLGTFAIVVIPKESAPEVQIPIAIVTTPFPGASAVDVEKLVTNKIEEQLANNLDDLKKLTSTSRESVSIVVAEFVASADIDTSVQEVKDEVDKVEPELPTDVEDPIITDVNFADQPIMIISITAETVPTEFVRLAETVEDALKTIPGVSRIGKSGVRDREVQVIVDKERLALFDLRLVDVIGTIAAANSSLPVGTIGIEGINYNLQFEGDIQNPSEIQDIAISTQDGRPVYVRDLAFVSDGVEEASTLSRISMSGNPATQAISLFIFKRSGGDITKISKDVIKKLDELKENILSSSEVLISFDSGELVEEDLSNLTRSGLQTIALVMVLLFLAIGWREALIAGIAIPLSFLISFIGLQASGNTINFVSLFSLILSVGILVDSAIVMVEGTHTKMKRQMDKREAALQTIKEFNWPLISGTATTIAVFAPLFFISGVTGEFIDSIPFTIIFVLSASLFVALGIVPLISATFLRRRVTSKLEEKQERYTVRFQNWYRSKLEKLIGNKKRERFFFIIVAAAFLITLSFPGIGLVKVIFFPQEDIDFIYAQLEMPQGTTLEETDLATRAIEEVFYEDDRIESFLTTIGESSSFDETEGTTRDPKLANITINLREDRRKTSTEIVEELRARVAPIKGIDVRVLQPNNGPPVGAPVVVKFFGEDLSQLEQAVDRAEDILLGVSGTVEVDTSTKDDNTEFTLSIDRAKASELGLSSALVAQTLRAAVHGIDATTIKTQGEDIDVVVKLNLDPNYIDPHKTNQVSVDAIRQIEIETPVGPVILGSVLETSLGRGNAVIRHEDRKRIATVSSELAAGATTREVLKGFEEQFSDFELPEGVTLDLGGENEEVDQSFRDMGRALVMGIVLIMTILILQFNSYRHAFYIIVVVPLSLIGIMIGLSLTSRPLSFPSIMGFIALSGIVVNNSIILIDTINKLRRREPSRPIREIVIEGATTRLRPILLTALTTVIGISPLVFVSELWAPLAYAIIFGLSFAVLITLIIVPVLYDRWPGKD